MAKMTTPAMERINKRRARKGNKIKRSTPGLDAWRRLTRNKTAILGMAIIIALLLMAIFAPLIAPYGYDEMDVMHMLEGPSSIHWFGTDNLGRDMLSRCIYGARITLPIAMFTVFVAICLGGTLGVLCAYFGGQFDNIVMRFIDIWGSIPGLMLSIAIVASSQWWTATMWSPPDLWGPAALTLCSSICCPMQWDRSFWLSWGISSTAARTRGRT